MLTLINHKNVANLEYYLKRAHATDCNNKNLKSQTDKDE